MAFRGRWSALALAPALILTGVDARATEPEPALSLPRGIHLGKNGRYYQDQCDHSRHRHCMAMRLLPVTYVPDTGRSPDNGNAGPSGECACNNENPCGGGETAVPEGAMKPVDVLTNYKIPASSAANGKIVGLVDFPDSTALSDVNVYRKAFGIAPLPACPGNGLPVAGGPPCFGSTDELGNVTTNSAVTDCPGADGETALDMDMVSAACPDCSILLVGMTSAQSEGGATDIDFVDSAKVAIKLGASAVSISFGGQEAIDGPDPMGHDFSTPGHIVLAAAGDSGYLDSIAGGTPEWPASAPDILGVGGTTMKLTGSTYSEVVWDDASEDPPFAGGSGCSSEFATPAFQTTFLTTHANAFGSCKKRASVDISAAAEFYAGNFGGGIAEYVTSGSGWQPAVGTSAATPMVAAILTRLGLTDAVSADLGWIYTNIAAFNDITSGTNDLMGTCSSILCKAGPGWDGPTGVGTPNGEALVAALNPPDAGTEVEGGTTGGDGGAPANADTPTTQKSGCGCRAGASPALDGLSFIAVAGVLGLAIRRRRRA